MLLEFEDEKHSPKFEEKVEWTLKWFFSTFMAYMVEVSKHRHAESHENVVSVADARGHLGKIHQHEPPPNFLGPGSLIDWLGNKEIKHCCGKPFVWLID